ncbi:DUF3040 domain-containing protein [Agrococcus casei]|uniref:Putative membrane protein n=1 Tax=Agrococcus casei LMG 22410 TaxID=1255656 RepID=A0A1R4G5K7_9MICO|nr:DUF3040 domain-containing protein [Agrococcus casei]SJM63461.1 putative membrane protein [Agrococcus casei LMG 22410]
MPLSEEEQRLLDEMERNLYKREADTVSVSTGPRTVNYTRVAIGLLIVLVGLGIVLAGVATKLIVIGAVGFVAAVAGLVVAFSASKPAAESDAESGGKAGASGSSGGKAKTGSSFMDRMSDEWDKRQERD